MKLAKNDDIDLAEIRRGQTSIAEQLDVIQQELLAKIDKCKSQLASCHAATAHRLVTFSHVLGPLLSGVRSIPSAPAKKCALGLRCHIRSSSDEI